LQDGYNLGILQAFPKMFNQFTTCMHNGGEGRGEVFVTLDAVDSIAMSVGWWLVVYASGVQAMTPVYCYWA